MTIGEGEPNETVFDAAIGDMGDEDAWVALLDASQQLLWARQISSVGYVDIRVAFRANGSIVLAGTYEIDATVSLGQPDAVALGGFGKSDVFVAEYGPGGDLLWIESFGSASWDEVKGIVVFEDGSFVVGGYFGGETTLGTTGPVQATLQTSGESDIFVAMWDASNALTWAVAEGTGAKRCEPNDMDALSSKGIFLTGFFEATATFGEGQPEETVLVSNGQHDAFVAKIAVPQ